MDVTTSEAYRPESPRRRRAINPDGLAAFLAPDLETAAAVLESGYELTTATFASTANISTEDAEARLRKMTQRGFLRMGAYRDESGAFIEYRWVQS